MGFGYLVVTAAVAAGCYFGYRKLKQIEEEIREELRAKGLDAEQGDQPVPEKAKPVVVPPASTVGEEDALDQRILSSVREQPGILQTELYKRFPDAERKAVQSALLKMDKSGKIIRTKEKSTYRIQLA